MNNRDRKATFQIEQHYKAGGVLVEERTGDWIYTQAHWLANQLTNASFRENSSLETCLTILASRDFLTHIVTRRVYRHHTNHRSSFMALAKPMKWSR